MNIPVNTPLFLGNEKKYLNECIDTGWISSEGEFISRFEKEFSNYIGVNFGIAVSNGSAALDIAVEALEIEKGMEVIVPAFTIISPVFSIIRAGLTPILIDSNDIDWNIDVTIIENRITPKTKAILIVHIYGMPVNMNPILDLCEKYNLFLIEDAAEMHGQTYNNKKCGSFGHLSIFSFYPNKHITTGEGGMILTNNPSYYEKCKKLRNLSFEPDKPRFIHYNFGWNYRMTNLQAAIGVAQLENIEKHIKRKREIGIEYLKNIKKTDFIQLPILKNNYAENIFWVFGIVAKSEIIRNKYIQQLSESGIGTRPFFYSMNLQPVFIKQGLFNNESYPISEHISKTGFYIPSGLGLKNIEVEYVIEKINKIKIDE
jgi:perosamine synthetase